MVVELEHPFPSFLNLLCHPIFSPVHQQTDLLHPNWSSEQGKRFVCNGPFCLEKRSSSEFSLIKNTIYWDHPSVHLQSIKIIKADAQLALELFQANQIDWLGRPIYPWYPFFNRISIEKHVSPFISIYWLVLNTKKFPFNCREIRQAFALATDQVKLLKDLNDIGEPAYTPLTKLHTLHKDSKALAYSPQKALKLFEAGLKKLGISRLSFPTLSLPCANNSFRKQIAEHIKQNLSEVLHINIEIELYDWPAYFKKLCEGDFLMGGMSWCSWIDDPSYTLQSFTEGERKTNFSKWENSTFNTLVNEGISEADPYKRMEYWRKAESLLIENVPVNLSFGFFRLQSSENCPFRKGLKMASFLDGYRQLIR